MYLWKAYCPPHPLPNSTTDGFAFPSLTPFLGICTGSLPPSKDTCTSSLPYRFFHGGAWQGNDRQWGMSWNKRGSAKIRKKFPTPCTFHVFFISVLFTYRAPACWSGKAAVSRDVQHCSDAHYHLISNANQFPEELLYWSKHWDTQYLPPEQGAQAFGFSLTCSIKEQTDNF